MLLVIAVLASWIPGSEADVPLFDIPATGATGDTSAWTRTERRKAKRDLIVFVGQRLTVTRSEPKPLPEGVAMLDAEFRARYKVLQIVFGYYKPDEISFAVFDHYGEPAFSHYETSLMFVARSKAKFYHEKYLFFPVYRTTDRRWATCGDAGQWEIGYEHKTLLKPMPITFTGDVINKATGQQCTEGNYVEDLFSLRRDGVLKARGWVF
jgi:hypothetical protein